MAPTIHILDMDILREKLSSRKIFVLEEIAGGRNTLTQLFAAMGRSVSDLLRELEDKGFIKIEGHRVSLTEAGRYALVSRPKLGTIRVSITRDRVEVGKGRLAKLVKGDIPPPAREDKLSLDLLNEAEKAVKEGKYRYALTKLLPLAWDEDSRVEIKRLMEEPSPRRILQLIWKFRKELGG